MPDRRVSKSTLAASYPSTTPAPVAAFVRLREVEARTGLSGKTIYRKMARGEFPKSVRLGANAVGWRESDLREWMANPMCWTAAA
ncbi:transcriptional regulator, AlpA family [Sphingomonas sp. NFR04]|uniref:AlpA family transcriptional regulator n=1 Tax=Sphingomonas sp. NFR04 TaxID=1566283 RepID=UPI0008E07E8B|nr:AlpA family transcriptional regulator [Sphingomonas sp. NFR04]SFK43934.1 transcriptional regulator, AlpA family [Sphingomonas sp. NFR04]